jgi:hypothetical protein
MKKRIDTLRRVLPDLLVLMSIIGILAIAPTSILPIEAKGGLLALVITKLILISSGIVHAHLSRKWVFPYIDFQAEAAWSNNLMIIAWYVVIIWGWARGG